MIELHAGPTSCTVSPFDGGRIASLNIDGVDLLVRQDPTLPPVGWGSYPMVPWAGRIRRGKFSFDGVDYALPINFEAHAIHGTGFEQSWEVTRSDASSCAMACSLGWLFGGTSEQVVELTEHSLTCTLAARAADRPMPASIGWHPWFLKPDKVDLQFERMYLRDDDYITDGRIAEPPPPPPWDDCFAGPLATPRMWINGIAVSITSDCDFWVVYDMPAHATCVEPQTATPDAFNRPFGQGGAVRLGPGEELRRSMTIAWA